MKRRPTLLPVLAMLAACRSASIAPTVVDAAGYYAMHSQSSSSWLVGSSLDMGLDLRDDLTFYAISNGAWGGSGVQVGVDQRVRVGTWSIDGQRLRFEVANEPAHVFVALDGATARLTADGLSLRSGNNRYHFERMEQRAVSRSVVHQLYYDCRAEMQGAALRAEPVRGAQRPDLVGHYDAENGAGPLMLDLRADGTYQCFALIYISSFGCGDVIGNGASSGEWSNFGDLLRFDVQHETAGTELSLVGATAAYDDGVLELTIGDRTFRLLREPKAR